ncbi:MAG: hypothetical protein QOI62_1551 [Solirubrobacteraceae bacterium]|jgi:drug/metabolite transporter (DMT)-like permease|nr:hypothetical protein [Solirubrobacteraceae bacterium]MEA2358291.1 hypothetical protein [Solirubrobacteraceae bacterium]
MTARSWALFIGVGTVWGTSFYFVDVALEAGVAPGFVTWVRLLVGAAALVAVAAHGRVLRISSSRELGWIALSGVLNSAAPFWLIALGQQHVAGSLASIIVAAVPIIVAAFTLLAGLGDRPNRRTLTGLALGFAGVVSLMGVDLGGRAGELLGAASILLGAACYAVAALILEHRLGHVDPRTTQSFGLLAACLVLTPLALVELPDRMPSAAAVASLVTSGLLGIGLAFIGFAALVRTIGPIRATVVSYVSPFVAIALGVGLAGEHLGPGAVAGLALILTGSYLAMRPAERDKRTSMLPAVVKADSNP